MSQRDFQVLRIFIMLLLFASLAGCGDVTGTTRLTSTGKAVASSKKVPRICEAVSAVAAGFGEENVTGLAGNNLDREIDKMKDSLVLKGAKGFTIEDRKTSCKDFIDFGGAVGREHLCRASAKVCGQTPA